MNFLLVGLGIVIGAVSTLILIALTSANGKDDIEHEKLVSYKEGYQRGYDDGYELRQSYMK